MNITGVRLIVLAGNIQVPLPLSYGAMETFESLEVIRRGNGQSVFQMVFSIKKGGLFGLLDYDLVDNDQLKPSCRIAIQVQFNFTVKTIFDGIIVRRDVSMENEPGGGTLTLTGSDPTVLMDANEEPDEFPSTKVQTVIDKIVKSYTSFNIFSKIIPPVAENGTSPSGQVRQRSGSDWAFIKRLARQHGYITYISPGLFPLSNVFYWGPPHSIKSFGSQKDLRAGSNVQSNIFNVSGSEDTQISVSARVYPRDEQTGGLIPQTLNDPVGNPQGAELVSKNSGDLRRTVMVGTECTDSVIGALSNAQAIVNNSNASPVRLTGTLDSLMYNDVLELGKTVAVKGSGNAYNGDYTVKEVTHKISAGDYKQSFTLIRSAIGAVPSLLRLA